MNSLFNQTWEYHAFIIRFYGSSELVSTRLIRTPRFGSIFCKDCGKVYHKNIELKAQTYNIYLSDINYVCYSCVIKREKNFILIQPLARLPLYINHMWVTEKGEEFYKDRLQGVFI